MTRTPRPWYSYLSDEGIISIYRKLMVLSRVGPMIRFTVGILVISAILCLIHALRQPFDPSDWVEVSLKNVPKGLRQIYLIADGPNGVLPLNFYFSSMLTVAAWEPRNRGEFWYYNTSDDQRFAPIQWVPARRYGAIAQRADGNWEVWWLDQSDLKGPSLWRYLVGQGEATIHLPDESHTITPTQELLHQLGLPDAPA